MREEEFATVPLPSSGPGSAFARRDLPRAPPAHGWLGEVRCVDTMGVSVSGHRVHSVCQLTLLSVWACVFVKVQLCVSLISVSECV